MHRSAEGDGRAEEEERQGKGTRICSDLPLQITSEKPKVATGKWEIKLKESYHNHAHKSFDQAATSDI